MAKKLDIINVIDLETTCWDNDPQQAEKSEVIEVGICEFDVATRTLVSKRSIIVKPVLPISDFCTKLTGITQKMVDEEGIKFFDAMTKIELEYHARKRTWASFGDFDREHIARECPRKYTAYPFGRSHINIKNLFALKHKLTHEVGMPKALQMIGATLTGRHHRGADDAENICKILATLL